MAPRFLAWTNELEGIGIIQVGEAKETGGKGGKTKKLKELMVTISHLHHPPPYPHSCFMFTLFFFL
jgi:hypothetical protein